MNRKRLLAVVAVVIIIVVAIVIRRRMGVLPIESAIAEHEEIDVEVHVKAIGLDEEPYVLVGGSVVSGEIEVMVDLLDDSDEYTYMEYKINGFNHMVAYGPSYSVTIDTRELPDGWNQLLLIGYRDVDKLAGVKQVIFKVENNSVLKTRAPRQGQVYALGEVPSYKRDYIPVLMYHGFQENITMEQESAIVHPKLFEEQLQALLENGYTAISFNDLSLYMNGEGGLPSKPVIITADDGYLSNYETAFPILKKYNIPATFFITSRYVGVDTSSPHFTWEQAKEMEESGLIDIQSHTHGHLLLNTIPDDEMRHQVDVSFGLIEQNLGKRDVKVLAYPQFYCNEHTKEILTEEGVDFQITRLGRRHKPTTEPTNVQRIHVANYTNPEDLIDEIKKLTR